MKVSEIVKLAAAGFKASDIKAFMDLEKDEALQEAVTPEIVKAEAVTKAEETDVKPEEPKKDFEALYKKTLEELNLTQKKLDAAQASNRTMGVVDAIPTIDDQFNKIQDLFRR